MPRALVTGSAGFIGFHLARRLLADGWQVVGLDAMSDYYDVKLKEDRHAILMDSAGFTEVIGRLEDEGLVAGILAEDPFDAVFHLAAQAGVRYSIEAPETYVNSNLIGTFRVLEAVRNHPVPHLLMASTSSAYGANTEMPYVETQRADHQMSFYAATKKANEAMAHSYAHLFDMPVTLFRFFTVYGPWGRPDMAPGKFARAIMRGEPIDVYNFGKMKRDFTYVTDLVEALVRLVPVAPVRVAVDEIATGDSLSPVAPFRVVNIGNAEPVALMDFIATLEAALGREARKNFMEMQPGDVPATWADTSLLQNLTGYCPETHLADGIKAFADWFRDYYGDNPK
ncbi:MAG: GDP-mannose 4,6-dehydratase [Paracoccaceae bacterium]|nr:GDP-mannose 4,6-dehydratase [Paracoccaceae bacterium]